MSLEFENVSLIFDKGVIGLENVTFEAKCGELTLIIGEQGSGKTSALFSACGIYDITTGSIKLNEKDISNLSTKEIDALYYGDETKLKQNKKVFYDIYHPLRLRQIKKADARELVKSTINDFNIKDLEDKKNKNLGLGEKEIVFLASAYARKATMLLFNNPVITSRFMGLAKSVAKKLNVPFIIALNNAHNIKLGEVDNVVILQNGIISNVGKLGELRANSNSIYEMQLLNKCSTLVVGEKSICFPIHKIILDKDGEYEGTIEYCDGEQSLLKINDESPCITIKYIGKVGELVRFNILEKKAF